MTTNYHTAISVGAAANAATFNTPLGALDAAITNAQSGVYNVLDYGAKGDNATDDTTAIQAAIDAADWGTVIFPPGSYRCTGITLDPTVGIRLIGSGGDPSMANSTVLVNTGTSSCLKIDNTAGSNNDNLIAIEQIAMVGSESSVHGILAIKVNGLRLHQVFLNTHGSSGVYLYACYNVRLSDCYINNNGASGVTIDICNAVTLDHCQISGNSRLSGYANVYIGGAGDLNIRITHCDLSSAGRVSPWETISAAYGILAGNAVALNIIGNYFETNMSAAIYLGSGVNAFEITGNYFQDSHIHFDTAKNGDLAGNYFCVSANTPTNVTGAVDNGAGLVRLTANGHGLVSDQLCYVENVGGVTGANGGFVVSKVNANTVDLVGSTFSGSYTSGGTIIQATGIRSSSTLATLAIDSRANETTLDNTVLYGTT